MPLYFMTKSKLCWLQLLLLIKLLSLHLNVKSHFRTFYEWFRTIVTKYVYTFFESLCCFLCDNHLTESCITWIRNFSLDYMMTPPENFNFHYPDRLRLSKTYEYPYNQFWIGYGSHIRTWIFLLVSAWTG